MEIRGYLNKNLLLNSRQMCLKVHETHQEQGGEKHIEIDFLIYLSLVRGIFKLEKVLSQFFTITFMINDDELNITICRS